MNKSLPNITPMIIIASYPGAASPGRRGCLQRGRLRPEIMTRQNKGPDLGGGLYIYIYRERERYR